MARKRNPARLVVALSVAAVLAVFLLYTSIAGGGTPSLSPSELGTPTDLLSLVAPNDPVKGKWSFTHLPVIPPEFELGPTDKKSAERLKLLVRLAKRKDVDSIINACDAGREGELIFRYIIQYAGVKKPIQRLWLQSMTQAAIREAFANLRDDSQLKPLEAAARGSTMMRRCAAQLRCLFAIRTRSGTAST